MTVPSLFPLTAALVIQGSACVYSKKVEYLHSLVYQALEFVAERKIKAVRNKDGADGADDKDEFDDNELFLTLDDTLEGDDQVHHNSIFHYKEMLLGTK